MMMSENGLMAEGTWAAAALLLLCGCATDHKSQRVTVSARSPQEVLRIFDKAVRAGDHATAVACIHPSQRRIVEKAARAKARCEQHASEVMALAAERFGEDTNQMLMEAGKSLRDGFAGVVPWHRELGESEVVEKNGRGVVFCRGRPTGLVLKMVDRQWYITDAWGESLKEECNYFTLMVAQQVKKYQLLAEGIKAGKLSEEDVKAVLSGQKVLPGERPKGPQGRTRVQKEGIGD